MSKTIEQLQTKVAELEEENARLNLLFVKAAKGKGENLKECFSLQQQLAAIKAENETAWAQAHRLALELECLLLDTKDNATVSKWWDSGMEALSEYQELQPGAAESAEAWAKMRKEMK